MKQEKDKKPIRPKQKIKTSEGQEEKMRPQPVYEKEKKLYRLEGKNAIITGGDSGIGRAIAIAFAKEGANVVISYYEDDKDARKTADIMWDPLESTCRHASLSIL